MEIHFEISTRQYSRVRNILDAVPTGSIGDLAQHLALTKGVDFNSVSQYWSYEKTFEGSFAVTFIFRIHVILQIKKKFEDARYSKIYKILKSCSYDISRRGQIFIYFLRLLPHRSLSDIAQKSRGYLFILRQIVA